ncbi:MAG: CorA family divalent cation transporter [Lachnospiraceae bacterium]
MIYKIEQNSVIEEHYNANEEGTLYAGIITLQELEARYEEFGIDYVTVEECKQVGRNRHGKVDIYNEYSFGIIDVINKSDLLEEKDRIGFYIRKNLFLIIDIADTDGSTRNTLKKMLERTKVNAVTMEKQVYYFLNCLINNDNRIIERMEKKISRFEKEVLEGNSYNFNSRLSYIRKELLVLRNYYEQLINISEELMDNENEIFENDVFRYFDIFQNRAERLSGNVQMLRELATQVWEMHQEQLDYNLNNVMKIFTVITTIFLPLTLIVGWYGMNFTNMPELTWKYGYLAVIILCIIVVTGCFCWFKKKKFF